MEAVVTPEAPPRDVPVFENAVQAAAWIEEYLKGVLTRDPDNINLYTRPTASTKFKEGELHVTEVVDPCYLRSIHRLIGTERDHEESESKHWAHTGLLYEAWVRSALREAFPGRIRSNTLVQGLPTGVQGYDDLWWKDTWTVIDVKSRSIGAGENGPSEKDKLQVAVYAAHRAAHYGHPVHAVLVYTYRQDLSKLDAFPVLYNPEVIIAQVRSNAATLQGWVQLQGSALPPVPPTMDAGKFPCSFQTRDGLKTCAFYSRCWPEGPAKRVFTPPEQVQKLMLEHRSFHQQKQALEAQLKPLEAELKRIKGDLEPVFQAHGPVMKGPAEWRQDLKMLVMPGRVTYDLEFASLKHPELGEMLEPYKKTGEGFTQLRYVKAG